MALFQERERTLPRLQRRHSIKGRFILLHFKFWRFKKAERHYISLFRELIRAVNQLSCHCIRIMPGTSNQSPGSKLALFRNLHSNQLYFYGFMLCQEPARRHLISLCCLVIRAVNQLSCQCIRIIPRTSNQSSGSKLVLFRALSREPAVCLDSRTAGNQQEDTERLRS